MIPNSLYTAQQIVTANGTIAFSSKQQAEIYYSKLCGRIYLAKQYYQALLNNDPLRVTAFSIEIDRCAKETAKGIARLEEEARNVLSLIPNITSETLKLNIK